MSLPPASAVVTTDYALGLLDLYDEAAQHGFGIQVNFNSFDSLITRARNTMVAEFLADARFTHLMWIDGDIGFKGAEFDEGSPAAFLYTFFDTMLDPDTRMYLSEDYAFCRLSSASASPPPWMCGRISATTASRCLREIWRAVSICSRGGWSLAPASRKHVERLSGGRYLGFACRRGR